MKAQAVEQKPASLIPRNIVRSDEAEERARRFAAGGMGDLARRNDVDTGERYFGSAGEPLPASDLAPLEQRFGHSLSNLRIHREPAATALAEGAEARALTVGQHIAFAEGEYLAGTPETQMLLAHEAAHALEQPTIPARQPKEAKKTGIGSTPPKDDYTPGEGVLPEDHKILFDFDSADIKPDQLAALKKIAESRKGIVKVSIPAYASSEGDPNYNRNLSAHRAAAVKRALEPLLDQGSTFELHAQGETAKFGEPELNRRAGIKFLETSPSDGEGAPGIWRPKPLDLGLGYKYGSDPKLRLDHGLDSQYKPPIFDYRWPIFGAPRPDPYLLTVPRLSGEPYPDHFGPSIPYTSRGIRTDERTYDSTTGFWNRSYQGWKSILGPEAGKTAADMTTSGAAEAEAARNHPSQMDKWKTDEKGTPMESTTIAIPLEKVVPKVIDLFKKKKDKK